MGVARVGHFNGHGRPGMSDSEHEVGVGIGAAGSGDGRFVRVQCPHPTDILQGEPGVPGSKNTIIDAHDSPEATEPERSQTRQYGDSDEGGYGSESDEVGSSQHEGESEQRRPRAHARA